MFGGEMRREIFGRVLEVRASDVGAMLVVLVNAEARRLEAPSLGTPPAPGALVRLELDD